MKTGLDSAQLRPLLERRDGPGLVRLVTQLSSLAALCWATLELAGRGSPFWGATVVAAGAVYATLFPPQHEAAHGTAFRGRWLNRLVLGSCAFAMWKSPSFFSEFHWHHHRHTQDPREDPEISGAPHLLDGWPCNPFLYLLLACGQLLLIGKAMFTVACAVLPGGRGWQRLFPFVRPEHRRRIAWESRLVLALWVALVSGLLHASPHGWRLLLVLPVAHVVLGLYLMPEHTGLPHEGSQAERTRTLVSNPLLRWWMWNMPLHAEHHLHPAVPFHALPALHEALRPRLVHVSRGYLAFHLEALRRAFGMRPRERIRSGIHWG